MSFFIPYDNEHASLSCPPLSWFYSALRKDPLPSSSNSKVSWSSVCLGLLGTFLTKLGQASFAFFFFLQGPMSLGFHLPNLIGPWLVDWAFLIFKGLLVLDFNTCNILDLNI